MKASLQWIYSSVPEKINFYNYYNRMRNLHRPGQVSYKQGQAAGKEDGKCKVTTRHIKQVASDLQAVKINLMWNQCRDLPASKHKKRKSFVKPRPPHNKNDTSDRQSNYKKSFDAKNVYRARRDVMSEVWRFQSHWRFPVSSKEVSMQILS